MLLKCESSFAFASLFLNKGSSCSPEFGGNKRAGANGRIISRLPRFSFYVSHMRLLLYSLSKSYDEFQQFEFEQEATHRSERISPCFASVALDTERSDLLNIMAEAMRDMRERLDEITLSV